jgi:rhodanese-related sulfurtransferase
VVEQISYARLAELLDGPDAQLVEVLPDAEYLAVHLPGAVNIPLKVLDADTTARLDRTRPVVVYCWDSL